MIMNMNIIKREFVCLSARITGFTMRRQRNVLRAPTHGSMLRVEMCALTGARTIWRGMSRIMSVVLVLISGNGSRRIICVWIDAMEASPSTDT